MYHNSSNTTISSAVVQWAKLRTRRGGRFEFYFIFIFIFFAEKNGLFALKTLEKCENA